MTVRQLVPGLLVAGLVGSAALATWLPAARAAFALVAGSYLTLVLLCSAGAARTHGFRCGAALLAVFPTLHFSYGAGFLLGIRDHLLTRSAPRTSAIGLTR